MILQDAIQFIHSKSIYRYIVIGLSAVFIEYSTFYILYSVYTVHLIIANSISFCLGLLTSFFLNRLWTFKSDNFQRKSHQQFILYSVLATINFVLSNLIISVLKYFVIDPLIGKPLVIILIASWNFILFKNGIFKTKTKFTK
jgi:putative flippase GtrA